MPCGWDRISGAEHASGQSPAPRTTISTDAEIAKFFGSEYTVQSGSDRVGMRLQGEAIQHAKGFNIASDATVPGSIQVPGNGQPIVLMADRQTTGGYPKIATVISADVPELGRLSIGSKISVRAGHGRGRPGVAARHAGLPG